MDREKGSPGDLQFDFEAYFAKISQGVASESEQDEFDMRLLARFCRDFYKNGESSDVPNWIMKSVADSFYKILKGAEWHDEFPLPWRPAEPVRTRSEERDLAIYCDIANAMRAFPDLKVTTAITNVAKSRNVSFETARAAWYKLTKQFTDDLSKK